MSDDDHVQVGLDRAVVEDDPTESAGGDSDGSDDATEPTNVTVQDCTEQIDAWKASLGEDANYGYYHLYTTTESTLAGTETTMCVRGGIHGTSRISHSHGTVMRSPVPKAVDWKCRHVATPFVPAAEHQSGWRCRTVPVDHLRVFIHESVWEHAELTIDRDTAGTVLDRLATLPEHTPDEDLRRQLRERTWCYNLGRGTDADLRTQRRALERTARAKLGFTTKFGHDVPDPHPDYADWPLADIREKLEAVRAAEAAAEERRDDLSEAITEYRQTWFRETVREQFPEVADVILDGGVSL